MSKAAADGNVNQRAARALDALNFFLADVRAGLGPYLAIYLLTVRHWNEAEIGLVMSVAAIAGILAQTPSTALVDAFRRTRLLVEAAAVAVVAGSIVLPMLSAFWRWLLRRPRFIPLRRYSDRRLLRFHWGLLATRGLHAESAGTKPSITPATRSQPRSREPAPIS
jgi:hypothetical protein